MRQSTLLVFLAVAVPAYGGYCGDCGVSIRSDQSNNHLGIGEALQGPSDVYATMQGDGNLVIYQAEDCYYYSLWATGTSNSGATNIQIQPDGNFVMYQAGGTPVWASQTGGQGQGPFCVRINWDERLELLDSTCRATWTSNNWSRRSSDSMALDYCNCTRCVKSDPSATGANVTAIQGN
ncbi:Aste57867_15188 [Aphanomyces stellatus]|uniref:Aste57867_15188 protein n=1 Tax=Aphanomyces stellatus TaxID=120398 RepID=A0A485L2J9_9STRA|nr:hypothetical protein As57867_015132 [Aphanomyces stellatus]VFT91997.1 Aste57867_15188 [Aphanomyces stellatus]